jgi:hypothetical protein
VYSFVSTAGSASNLTSAFCPSTGPRDVTAFSQEPMSEPPRHAKKRRRRKCTKHPDFVGIRPNDKLFGVSAVQIERLQLSATTQEGFGASPAAGGYCGRRPGCHQCVWHRSRSSPGVEAHVICPWQCGLMSTTKIASSTSRRVRTCNAPSSLRNPWRQHCQLPAGHDGAHQWDRGAAPAQGSRTTNPGSSR